jgi:hypothetical protein
VLESDVLGGKRQGPLGWDVDGDPCCIYQPVRAYPLPCRLAAIFVTPLARSCDIRPVWCLLNAYSYIKEEMFGTVPEDINLAGYDKHLESAAAPAPLSMEEAEKEEIRSLEVGAEIGASTKKALMATGVAFPMTPEAEAAIKSFQSGEVTYVQLSLDGKTEMINLELAETLTCEVRSSCTSDNSDDERV